MSKSSHQAPLSPASAAHDAFGNLWGLIFLGALRGSAPVPLPFGPVMSQFVDSHADDVGRVVTLIQKALVLPDDALAIFDEPRSRWPDNLQDADGVGGWLLLYTRNRRPWPLDLGDPALIGRLVEFGVSCQLYGLVGAVTLGVAAHWRGSDDGTSPIRELLIAGAALAGESEPARAARRSFEAWSVSELGRILSPSSGATDEARSQIRAVVDRLEASLGHDDDA